MAVSQADTAQSHNQSESREKLSSLPRNSQANWFNEAFDSIVAAPLIDLGGEQHGLSVFCFTNDLTIGLFRTELRYMPPPALTLFVRHRCLRTVGWNPPDPLTKFTSDYPIKIRPSDAGSLLDEDFRYTPLNLGRHPKEVFDYKAVPESEVRQRFGDLQELLVSTISALDQHLTPERLLRHLVDQGEDASMEQMWIADLRSLIESKG